MAVDKCKPLKFESPSTGGTQWDYLPTEAKPTEDFVAVKGVAFEGLDTFLQQKLGRVITEISPDGSQKPTYTGIDLTSIEFFNSATQITANRIARVDITYTGIDPTSEVWKIYDTDGTTVLRTTTFTHTFVSNDLTNTTEVAT